MPNPPPGFEWDEAKAQWNLRVHGVSFAAAVRFDFAGAIELENNKTTMTKSKKNVSKRSGKSAKRFTSSSMPGVRETSELSAFEGLPRKKSGSTSRRRLIDPDNPPLTEEQLKRMRPVSEENKALWREAISKSRAFLHDVEWTVDMAESAEPLTNEESRRLDRKLRGRPPIDNPKQAISLRLDQDVIEHFKRGGAGWQSRMNAALRKQAKLKP